MTLVPVVFDIESDPPRPIGTFIRTDEDVVVYLTPENRYATAPADCVTVVDVDPIAPKAPAVAESATRLIVGDDAIDDLRRRSTPVPGRDGVRRDADGRVWYSARWIGLQS